MSLSKENLIVEIWTHDFSYCSYYRKLCSFSDHLLSKVIYIFCILKTVNLVSSKKNCITTVFQISLFFHFYKFFFYILIFFILSHCLMDGTRYATSSSRKFIVIQRNWQFCLSNFLFITFYVMSAFKKIFLVFLLLL